MKKSTTLLVALAAAGVAALVAWSACGERDEAADRPPAGRFEAIEPAAPAAELAGEDALAPRVPVAAEPAAPAEDAPGSHGEEPPLGTLAITLEVEGDPAATAFAAAIVERESDDQVAFVRRGWGDREPVRVALPPGNYVATLRESLASPPPLYLGSSELTRTARVRADAEELLRIRTRLGGRFVLETRSVPAGRPLEIHARREGEEEWLELRLITREISDELTFWIVATRGRTYTTQTLEPGRWSVRVTEQKSGVEVATAEADLLPGEIRHVTL